VTKSATTQTGVAETPGLEYKAAATADTGTGASVIGTDDDTGVVEALVSVTGVVDSDRDIIEPGAYKDTLTRRRPKGIFSHDWKQWASRTEVVEELMPGDPRLADYATQTGKTWPAAAGALYVKTRYNLATPEGRSAYENVKFFGDECQWSIGYKVPAGKAVRSKDGVRRIREVDLYEYSPVLFGAASLSGTLSVKAAVADIEEDAGEDEADFEDGLDDVGEVDDAEAAEVTELAEALEILAEAEEWHDVGDDTAADPGGDIEEDEPAAEEDLDGADGDEDEPEDEAKAIPGGDTKPAPKSGSGSRATTPGGDGDTWKITNVEQLRAAVRGFGAVKASEREKVKAHIMKRAFALNRPDLIPDGWKKTRGKSADGWAVELMTAALDEVAAVVDGLESKREFSAEQRRRAAKDDAALPDGSYPIRSEQDLRNAVSAYGRAKPEDRAKVRAHIMRRARAIGHPELIPDDWKTTKALDELPDGWSDDDVDVDVKWDPSQHPRAPAGSAGGGQFMAYDAKKNTGTGYGKKGGDSRVRDLQTALNRLGFTDGKGRRLDVDGQLGPLTTSAVKAAQKKLGVPADGKVSAALLNKLIGNAKKKGKPGVHAQEQHSGGKPAVRAQEQHSGGDPKKKPKKPTAKPKPKVYAEASGTKGSSASLNRSPRKNWVEVAGELPPYVREVARSIHDKRGMPLENAIPIAIAQIKKWAAKGNAKAVKALAEWEALKAKSHARTAARHAAGKTADELTDVPYVWGGEDDAAPAAWGTDWGAEVKAFLPGTFEQLRDDLHDAVAASLADDEPCLVELLGTWPDRVVATRYTDTKAESFEVPYTLDAGTVEAGEPVPVTVTVDHDGYTLDGAHLSPLPGMVEEVTVGAKALLAADAPGWETKAGRVLSGVNATRLKSAVENLVAVLKAAGIEIGTPNEPDGEPEPPREEDSTAPSVRGEPVPAGKMLVDPALHARAYRILGAVHGRG
jgi:peptidoglycan hydrolase-like protein with peptidoglycan-binding domain/phage head maturation protease